MRSLAEGTKLETTLNRSEFYRKYGALIYGRILRLTLNKSIADKIFLESFIELYENSMNSKKGRSTIPSILRIVYSTTLLKLKEFELRPAENTSRNGSGLL